jgi:hypothetical protein
MVMKETECRWRNETGAFVAKYVVSILLITSFVGCKPDLNSHDAAEGLKALEEITDQEVLTELAIAHPYPEIAMHAAQRVTDESRLKDIAIYAATDTVGLYALSRISDQVLLLEIGNSTKHISVCIAALDRVPGQAERAKLIADAENLDSDVNSIPRLRLAFLDPRLSARLPRLKANLSSSYAGADYEGIRRSCSVRTQRITIRVYQDAETLVEQSWETQYGFPQSIPESECGTHVPYVQLADVLGKLLVRGKFTQDEINQLWRDLVPMLRLGPVSSRRSKDFKYNIDKLIKLKLLGAYEKDVL